MGELVLRAPRDADLAHTLGQTDASWHRTLRDLLARASAEGELDPELNADDAATLLIVAIKGLSLPTVAGFRPESTDQVFRQFERLLGLPPEEPYRPRCAAAHRAPARPTPNQEAPTVTSTTPPRRAPPPAPPGRGSPRAPGAGSSPSPGCSTAWSCGSPGRACCPCTA